MKITPEDMQAIRDVWFDPEWPFKARGLEERDTALALILVSIYDRGYEAGHQAAIGRDVNACPYTFAHTRHWCGYDTCRDS